MKTLIVGAAALMLLLAGSAAAEGSLSATLETPQSAAPFIAAHAVWHCAGADCVASVAPDDASGLGGCQELVRRVGRVTAFSDWRKTMDQKGLAKCNAVARTPSVNATASR